MLKGFFLLFSYSFALQASELSFNEAQKRVLAHELLQASRHRAQALEGRAQVDGAWGDPVLSIGANNLPIDHNFKRDVTPMTGISFGIAQKIPLGARIANKEEASLARAKKAGTDGELLGHQLMARLWINLISIRRMERDLNYLSENERWLESMVKVSKKLYSNGKITQQALLDIQIRHNQVLAQQSEKRSTLKSLRADQAFLLGENKSIDLKTVPWKKLTLVNEDRDLKASSLELGARSAELERSASRWARIPEVTVGLNYIKRENIDGKGDFASLMLSFPMPFGNTRSGSEVQANQDWLVAQNELKSYQREKGSRIESLSSQLESLKEQQELTKRSLSFARTARETSAKSYRLGALSYFDLLQAELRQQELEFKSNELEAKVAQTYLEEKLIHSDVLISMEQ